MQIQDKLVRCLKYSCFRKGQSVYRIGDQSEWFTLILQGEAVQLLPRDPEIIQTELQLISFGNQSQLARQISQSTSVLVHQDQEKQAKKQKIQFLRQKSIQIVSLSNSPSKIKKEQNFIFTPSEQKTNEDPSSGHLPPNADEGEQSDNLNLQLKLLQQSQESNSLGPDPQSPVRSNTDSI